MPGPVEFINKLEELARSLMSQAKRKPVKPLLTRKETKTLLTTLKWTTVAGTLSLTMAGWSLLAQADAGNSAQAAANQAIPATPTASATSSSRAQASVPRRVVNLNVVAWVRDSAGDPVAVVRDSRGTLWYVLGSDIPRLEQGLPPQVQPQPVQRVTRSRAS